MALVSLKGGEREQVACIGQLVQIYDGLAASLDPIEDKISAYKLRPPVTSIVTLCPA